MGRCRRLTATRAATLAACCSPGRADARGARGAVARSTAAGRPRRERERCRRRRRSSSTVPVRRRGVQRRPAVCGSSQLPHVRSSAWPGPTDTRVRDARAWRLAVQVHHAAAAAVACVGVAALPALAVLIGPSPLIGVRGQRALCRSRERGARGAAAAAACRERGRGSCRAADGRGRCHAARARRGGRVDADGGVQPRAPHLAPLATATLVLLPFHDHHLVRDRATPRTASRAALKPRREGWVQALHEGGEAKVADLDQHGLCTRSSDAAAAEPAHACCRGSSVGREGRGGRRADGAATAAQWERGVAAAAAAGCKAGAAAHGVRPRPRPRGGRGGVAGG